MQKKLFRILSVFLAVVIVSVMFMQPIAYANPVAVGGGALVLLVAGLLITCGMVFTTQAQAEAVSNYAISMMPSALRQELDNVIHVNFPDNWGSGSGGDNGGDPDPKMPKFKSLITGFATSVAIGSTLYIQFKEWVNETFGLNEETAVAGSVVSFDAVFPASFPSGYTASVANQYPYIVITYAQKNMPDYDYHFSCFSVKPTFNGTWVTGNSSIQKWTVHHILEKRWLILQSGPAAIGYEKDESYLIYTNFDVIDSRDGSVYFASTDSLINPNIDLSQEAYNYTIPVGQNGVPIGIMNDINGLITKDYTEIIDDYSFENWDYNADLEKLIDMIDGTNVALDGAKDYGALLEQAQALKDEVDKLRGVVADQGADAVGGTVPLDDAMYDTAKLLENIKDLIDAKEKDADKIRDLEEAVEKAKDAIKELTPKPNPNPDPEPNPNPNPDPEPNPNPNPDPEPNPNPNPDPEPNPNPNPDPEPNPNPNPDPEPNPNPNPDPEPNPNPNPDPEPNPNPNPNPDPDPDTDKKGKINWKKLLEIAIFDKFPFSIPKDIYSFFDALAATPKEPVFVFDIFAGKFGPDAVIVLHFRDFEDIRKLVRNGILIMLVIGLIAVTKKYVWK